MFEYKTEMLYVSLKFFSDKASIKDDALLDELINERAKEAWELVTYDYMATSSQIQGAFLVTFKRKV